MRETKGWERTADDDEHHQPSSQRQSHSELRNIRPQADHRLRDEIISYRGHLNPPEILSGPENPVHKSERVKVHASDSPHDAQCTRDPILQPLVISPLLLLSDCIHISYPSVLRTEKFIKLYGHPTIPDSGDLIELFSRSQYPGDL